MAGRKREKKRAGSTADGASAGLSSLIEGIRGEAGGEAEKIVGDAEKEAKRKREYADSKAQALVKEAEEEAVRRSAEIINRVLSAVETEIKHRRMESMEKLYRDLIERARENLRDLVDGPAYAEIIENLIVEGAIGLPPGRVSVTVSSDERIHVDEKLLRRAERRVSDLTGSAVSLTLSPEPAGRQGVLLRSEDGRMNYNNLIDARIPRKMDRIRGLMYESLLRRFEGDTQT
jgi:vacuolar-type H+-ATPase subunit E/Vma4